MKNRSKFNRGQQQQSQGQSQAADVFEEPVDPFETDSDEEVSSETDDVKPELEDEDFVVRDEQGVAIGIRGATGTVGDPGPVGEPGPIGLEESEEPLIENHEDQVIDPSEIEDEREAEDGPELDQDHDETETEDEDEIVEDEEEVVDPTTLFPYTEVTEWSVEQLELYISRPENIDIYHSKLIKAIEIHRQLSPTLNVAWSYDECTAFFKEGITPPKATTGCYLNDVTRKTRRESSWTTQELEAWALGEIKAEGLVTLNGLAVELHNRFSMPIQSVDPDIVIAHYKHNFGPNKAQVKLIGERPVAVAVQPAPEQLPAIQEKIKYAGLTEMSQTYIEQTLNHYVDTVRTNRVVTEKIGFPAQRELDTLIHYILKQEDPAAVKSGLDILFNKIIAERIDNPRGVFSDTNGYRFVGGVSEVARAQETHRRLLTLFFAFVDNDEGILAQTDVPTLIEYLPARHQNLLQAYLGRS